MAYQYKKGHEVFEGEGRPKGSKTKNAALRELIRDFCVEKFETYVEMMDALAERAAHPLEGEKNPVRPSEWTREYREMLKFVVPAITAIQFESGDKISDAQSHLRALSRWGEQAEEEEKGQDGDSGDKRQGNASANETTANKTTANKTTAKKTAKAKTKTTTKKKK